MWGNCVAKEAWTWRRSGREPRRPARAGGALKKTEQGPRRQVGRSPIMGGQGILRAGWTSPWCLAVLLMAVLLFAVSFLAKRGTEVRKSAVVKRGAVNRKSTIARRGKAARRRTVGWPRWPQHVVWPCWVWTVQSCNTAIRHKLNKPCFVIICVYVVSNSNFPILSIIDVLPNVCVSFSIELFTENTDPIFLSTCEATPV